MDEMSNLKKAATKARWDRAMKEKPFDRIRNLSLLETRAEHVLRALTSGTVSTNLFLRRLHNFSLDMNWLPAPVIPRRQWPKIEFKDKRAITHEEHQNILRDERNPEWRTYYQLLWHLGVVGIVASRVVQEFYRPTIILGGDGAEWRGSGRSIEGFDLAAALRDCNDLLVRHGGHAMAAGVSIRPDRIEEFRARLNDLARRALSQEQLQPTLRLDAEVTTAELSLERVRELGKLQQTGMGNPPVRLFLRDVMHQRPLQRMGQDKRHVRLWITDGRTVRNGVWWGAGESDLPTGRFDLAFTPQVNDYNGSTSVQLKVLDWRPAR